MKTSTLPSTAPAARVISTLLWAALAVAQMGCEPPDDPEPTEAYAHLMLANFSSAGGPRTFEASATGEYTPRVLAEDVPVGGSVGYVDARAATSLSFFGLVIELTPNWHYTLLTGDHSGDSGTYRLILDHLGQTDMARAYLRQIVLRAHGDASLRNISSALDGRALEIPFDDFVDVSPGVSVVSTASSPFDSGPGPRDFDLNTELEFEGGHYYTVVVYSTATELNPSDPAYALAVIHHGVGGP